MFTNCVVERRYDSGQLATVLTKTELLAALETQGVKNSEMEKVLGLPSSRVSEIRWATPGREPPPGKKARELTYDEGVKLVLAFGLDEAPQAQPLPAQILRLVVRYLADRLGAEPTEDQLRELTEDVRAFGAFVSDQKVRRSLDAAEGFFRALRLRRPETEKEARPETDPHRVR